MQAGYSAISVPDPIFRTVLERAEQLGKELSLYCHALRRKKAGLFPHCN